MQEFKGRVAGVEVKPVDTTGAGDAFVGGILSNLASDLNLFKVSLAPCVIERDEIYSSMFLYSTVITLKSPLNQNF